MVFFEGVVRAVSLLFALSSPLLAANAEEMSTHPMGVHFNFEFDSARIVSMAVSSGDFDEARFADFCTWPDAKALRKKMRLKDCDALLVHLKSLRKSKKTVAAAELVTSELSKPANGRYAPLAAEVTRQIREYIPSGFSANLNVHFIFGSHSGGFAFDDVPDDVYVNLARFSDATTQELAETVAHELFHAVQTHVMKPESLPKTSGPAATTGRVWLNHLLANLAQEGTAELFTHPIADRATTPYSSRRKLGIERNTSRIHSLVQMFETLGWRLLYVPPNDEDAYDQIYGLMFYTDFDETAYDLGWLMASTIATKDGKMAIFELLKQEPKNFLLRYQAIARADGKLPVFSDEFMRAVAAI